MKDKEWTDDDLVRLGLVPPAVPRGLKPYAIVVDESIPGVNAPLDLAPFRREVLAAHARQCQKGAEVRRRRGGIELRERLGQLALYLEPRDWWIGYYRGTSHHYVCVLPCVVIRWNRR